MPETDSGSGEIGAGLPGPESRLVRIPRHLLRVELDHLLGLGVPLAAHDALRGLMADLPLVPDATYSAHLIGPPSITLPCLAVLARHVGQGLRDHNLSLAHDRTRLHAERRKLVFLGAAALETAIASSDPRAPHALNGVNALHESVLFLFGTTPALEQLLAARDAANLATYVASPTPQPHLAHWRPVYIFKKEEDITGGVS